MSGLGNKQRWSRKEKRRRKAQLTVPPSRAIKQRRHATQLNPVDKALDCATKAIHTHAVSIHLPREHLPSALTTLRVVTTTNLPSTAEQQQQHHDDSCPSPTTVVYVKPLLVLDLNGILCHRIRKGRPVVLPSLAYRPSVGNIAGTPIIPRVHIHSFLTYLEAHFTLAVWTSAKAKTARALIKILMPETIVDKLLFVWSQSKCRAIRRANQQSDRDTVFLKPLELVWNEFPLWNSANTVLMDDSPAKCPDLYKSSAVHPPPLHGKQQARHDDESMYSAAPVADGQWHQQSSSLAGHPMSDERNEELQLEFFQQLANHFYAPRTTASLTPANDALGSDASQDKEVSQKLLVDFLSQQTPAIQHMGWQRGS